MTDSDQRWEWDVAHGIAEDLVRLLESACERIVVAGSLRRLKADIGDIDLVCQPKTERETVGLFDDQEIERDLLHERCAALVDAGVLEKRLDKNDRPTWGTSLKRARYRGLGVDIQSVMDKTTWGAWVLIRTGPAEFNRAIVTPKYQGGLLPSGFEWRKGAGFQLYRGGGRVETPTEESVFAALRLPYLDPSQRGLTAAPPAAAGTAGER